MFLLMAINGYFTPTDDYFGNNVKLFRGRNTSLTDNS